MKRQSLACIGLRADQRICKVRVQVLAQYNTEAILREHIERLGGTVEYGTMLRSFEQRPDRVDAMLVTQNEGTEQTESVVCHWLVGADGPEGTVTHPLPVHSYPA